ncbi:hypothetical protein ACHAXT_010399 [Thalassiosira profunda]
MKYTATDGTVFTDRALYRRYEMEKQYTYCEGCEVLLLDNTDQVQIDNVSDSRIFIAAASGSVFVRNCTNCSFTVACKQLRTRDCQDCTFNLYCRTEPAIETSTGMRFAPFNGAYPGHRTAMILADLDPLVNKWDAVYDFNDPSETLQNWSIVPIAEQDPLWRPLGEWAKPCIPREDPEARTSTTEEYALNDSFSDVNAPSTPLQEEEPSGPLHNIRVFACGAWTILSEAVCSVQSFCLGLIFSGLQIPNKMLSQR